MNKKVFLSFLCSALLIFSILFFTLFLFGTAAKKSLGQSLSVSLVIFPMLWALNKSYYLERQGKKIKYWLVLTFLFQVVGFISMYTQFNGDPGFGGFGMLILFPILILPGIILVFPLVLRNAHYFYDIFDSASFIKCLILFTIIGVIYFFIALFMFFLSWWIYASAVGIIF